MSILESQHTWMRPFSVNNAEVRAPNSNSAIRATGRGKGLPSMNMLIIEPVTGFGPIVPEGLVFRSRIWELRQLLPLFPELHLSVDI
jgi:hypothetical protein